MKHLANIVTFSRIILSLCLFLVMNNTVLFIALFALAWLTDGIDGTIAKKTNSQSELGEKLDDIADITLTVVAITILAIWLKSEALIFLPFLIVLIMLKAANAIITKKKYGKAIILHTFLAKITFVFIFFVPVIYLLTGNLLLLYITLSLAILTALEEGIIHLTSETYNPKRLSFFTKKKKDLNE